MENPFTEIYDAYSNSEQRRQYTGSFELSTEVTEGWSARSTSFVFIYETLLVSAGEITTETLFI